VPSLGKKRFICVIVDDYSRYTWVIFLSQKSDTYANFVEYCNRVENEKGLKINTIRSDHGGEFEKMLNLMTYALKKDIDMNTRPLEHHNKMGS
jgi:GH35 family endo-1,4-beta-xylanase